MNTYQKLLTENHNSYWEDLPDEVKNKFIIAYVLNKEIKIPCETSFKKIILNIINPDYKLEDADVYAKVVFFQAIKQQIERDLEKEWMEFMALSSLGIGQYNHY